MENFIATEAQDRQRTYAFYVKGLIKGALKNLGAGIGGQAIEVCGLVGGGLYGGGFALGKTGTGSKRWKTAAVLPELELAHLTASVS